MKRMILFLAVLASVSSFAKKIPDWTLSIEGNPIAIFKHSFTGIPIVETSKHYYGINYVDKSILWSVKKSEALEALNQAGNIASMTGATNDIPSNDMFQEIPFTPFASINNSFIDISTGHVLFGQDDEKYKTILSHDIIPDLYLLLVKVKAENGDKILYSIDLESKKVEWKQVIAVANTANDLLKSAVNNSSFATLNKFAPKTTSNKNIVYKHESTLFLLNPKDGSIIWKNECKPGTFFLDNNQQYLVVVKQASGLGGAMSIKGPSAFGKELFALDLKTGEEVWSKPIKLANKFSFYKNINDELFVVAHEKGINIYDYKTGSRKWKKDYETKRVQDLEIKSDGIEVFYGNKIMLVNTETGKKAWKKPIEFDDVPEDEDGDMIKKDYTKGTFIMGGSFVGLFDKSSGKKIWKMSISDDAKAAFDNKNNKVALIDGKKFYLFDPNTVSKKPEKIKVDINKPNELIGFETKELGYFITGMNEYIMLDKKGLIIGSDYFKQLKTDRLLKAALTTTAYASGLMSTTYTVENSNGEEVYSGGVFTSKENAKAMGEVSDAQFNAIRKLKEEAKLRGAAVSTKDYAYFLKSENTDGTDHMSIVKVEKKTGKEVDNFEFGDNRKVIFELDKTTNKLYFLDGGNFNAYDLK